jgi:DNA-3-methyladenine glycosylase II
LQPAYPGLRPVCFWSPYEAAAWAIIGQRVRIVQAAAIKARIAAKHGVRVATGEHTRHAFPSPAALLEVDAFPRLTPEKIQRLHAVARCALEGGLDAGMLRSLKREDALAHLRTIHGIGPFSAELILLRGAGDPDHVPTAEPRLARAIALAYGLDHHPGPEEVLSISRAWAPYRTWVALLLRNHLEAETHEIANGGRRRSTVPRP